MLKQSLQQRLLQKLSPQQIQVIKLLEIPVMQLEQRIKKELEENPALEDISDNDEQSDDSEIEEQDTSQSQNEDEFSFDDYIEDEYEIPNYKLFTRNYSKDEEQKEIPFSVGYTFHEHLRSQLGLRILTEHQLTISEYILGNIDEDGYLRREVNAIVDDLAFNQNITTNEAEVTEVLKIIQELEPPGIGARNLQECLLLQLMRKEDSVPVNKLAITIINDFFHEFTNKHYDKIIKRLALTEKDLKKALDEILKLNPKPGSSYSDPLNKSFQHVTPDFILENIDGEFHLNINQKNVPELRLNLAYINMYNSLGNSKNGKSAKAKEAVTFVKQKLESAKWFIDAVKQRQNTLMLTMNAILNYQNEFFKDGNETLLKPMILKDIAQITGLDISTVSRVVNSKYIQTQFGIYPLKYFFSEGLLTDSGEEASSREIKKILQECIENESKKRPLTDEKLTAILKQKGYQIARRTVAKYREQLNIPVARLRKELRA
ncbi:MAG: RNA polymerase factor sigma-54 [Bacteroidia bacterium]|nr:RNA polymerase factor sigma-54 [Bacteroidia bacterium]